jgi:hypothetical protein
LERIWKEAVVTQPLRKPLIRIACPSQEKQILQYAVQNNTKTEEDLRKDGFIVHTMKRKGKEKRKYTTPIIRGGGGCMGHLLAISGI